MLQELVSDTHILSCGKEEAVAATKSVIEQGLFYDSLFHQLRGIKMKGFLNLQKRQKKLFQLKYLLKLLRS